MGRLGGTISSPVLGRRQAGRVSPCPWHGQPGPGYPVLTHSLFGQNAGLDAKSWELDKGKGSNEIGSESQLLGTAWVPSLCLQLLPALALRLVSWVRPLSEEVGGILSQPFGWTLHTSPECMKQSQGSRDNSMRAGSR